jgi:hypothetical protein
MSSTAPPGHFRTNLSTAVKRGCLASVSVVGWPMCAVSRRQGSPFLPHVVFSRCKSGAKISVDLMTDLLLHRPPPGGSHWMLGCGRTPLLVGVLSVPPAGRAAIVRARPKRFGCQPCASADAQPVPTYDSAVGVSRPILLVVGTRARLPSSSRTTRRRNMRSHLYGALAIAAMIATPAMAQTTTPTANTMSTPGPGAGTSTPTLSHDGSASPTNTNASSASNSPGAGASPHTGFSSGMTPSAGTASGTADGTTDTGATSPGSGKSAAQR